MHYHYKSLLTNPKVVIYLKSLTIRLNNFIQEINYLLSITIRVTEIDNMQKATLVPFKDNAAPLKKVPCDQLRPYKRSELHDIQKN